jgi:hypothetical protein
MSTVPPPPPPSDPYRSPRIPSRSGVSNFQAAADVSGPATGLIITAIIGGLFQAFGLFMNMLGTGLSSFTSNGREEQILSWLSGGFGVASALIGLLIAGLVLYAAMEMKKLRQWGLAVAASILAMVPCISPCCFIGLPVGIWSLVVLVRDEVKTAFH